MLEFPPISVLVVDESRDIADSTAELLEICGHRVTVAYEVAAAHSAAVADPPDVVVVEPLMRRCDGWTLATLLRMNPITKRCYIVAVSTNAGRLAVRMSVQCGIDRHLLKPLDPLHLCDIVEARRSHLGLAVQSMSLVEKRHGFTVGRRANRGSGFHRKVHHFDAELQSRYGRLSSMQAVEFGDFRRSRPAVASPD